MERAVGKNEKLESFKLESLKLESSAVVGKNRAKLERAKRSWKEPSEVGKNRARSESFNELGKLSRKLKSVNGLNN